MREILFRGKAKNRFRSPWVEGYFMDIIGDGTPYIATITPTNDKEAIIDGEIVIPETIGQYIGLTDKNGKKIFEGDFIKFFNHIYKVEFDERTCKFSGRLREQWSAQLSKDLEKQYEVIGNIHDNPQLLKEGGVKYGF